MTLRTTTKDVAGFLEKTGFVLEMQVMDFLRRRGYAVDANPYFRDREDGKKREIDIVAKKIVNNIELNLVIECKQSLRDDWVFVCSDARPKRYYSYLKYSPVLEKLEYNIFKPFHTFDSKIPLAQNFVSVQKKDKKQVDSLQIKESLHKLPKALLYFAADSPYKRQAYFLVTIFSGDLFAASYQKKLSVRREGVIQFVTDFESESYKKNTEKEVFDDADFWESISDDRVITNYKRMGNKFLIDFVSFFGLRAYLKRLETGAKSIEIAKWPVKDINKEELPF